MIECRLMRLATAVGATWWLVRAMVSRAERRKLNDTMQRLDETIALVGGATPLGQLRGSVLSYDDPTKPIWPPEQESD